MNRLLVMTPCHNEAGRIGTVIARIRQVLPAADILVLNDASTDTSPDEAARAGARVLTHASNLGYGGALETGYLYALKQGYGTVLQLDSDGQHLPEELPKLLTALSAADIAIGSRYQAGVHSEATSPLRLLGHRLFALLIRLLTGLRLTDPSSGFQALGPRALRLLASGVFPCDYPDADVILMAHLSGLRIREVPVTMRARQAGQSMHAGLRPLYYGIKMVLSMFIVLLNYRLWREWRRALTPPAEERSSP